MLATARPAVQQCVRKTATRSFFAKTSAMPQIALDEEFPSVPKTQPQPAKVGQITTSTTASGLKIASNSTNPLVATLGVEIAAGSRVETDETAGLSQLFAQLAFRATSDRSDLRLYRDIEAIGGVVTKSAGRDFIRYNISVLPDRLDAAAAILAETTLAPRFAGWDIALQKDKVKVLAEQIAKCSERSVFENVHAAAFYDDVTLGRSIASTDNLAALDADALVQFYEQYVNNAGLVVVGSGVEHSTLTDIANEFFAGLPAGTPLAKTPAKYVGGESRVKKAPVRNTYVALGFQTAGTKSADFGASQVLQAVLSSRLSGKNTGAFLSSFEDVGIVGLSGYAAPAQAGALVDSFVAEIKKVASAAPSNEELAAAKTLAAFDASNAVATREGRVAQLGALAFAQGKAVSPLAAVEGVSAKAVQELAQKALASRPSLASVGKLSTVPRLDAVISKLK